MAEKTYEEALQNYTAFRLHKRLMLQVSPILLVFGTIGNILSFVTLARRAMRNCTSHIYLAVLAITDTLVLYIG